MTKFMNNLFTKILFILTVAFSFLSQSAYAAAGGGRREAFSQIRYFAHAGTGNGLSAADPLPIVDDACYISLPAGSVVNRASAVITTLLGGTTVVTVGDADDPDGYIDANDVTEGTVGFYPGTGALIDTEVGIYYSAAKCLQLDITTTSTSGAFAVEVSGYRL